MVDYPPWEHYGVALLTTHGMPMFVTLCNRKRHAGILSHVLPLGPVQDCTIFAYNNFSSMSFPAQCSK
jgi:hypothetical protein